MDGVGVFQGIHRVVNPDMAIAVLVLREAALAS
jgi:hypothetical protein